MATNAINGYAPTYYYYNSNGSLVGQKTREKFFEDLNNDRPYSLSSTERCSEGDGINDGKISTGSKIGNFLKGLVKPITSMFKSPGNFIKGALGIAACAGLCWITGGAATPFLVGAGIIGGGIQIAKGAINSSNAKTDAEAEAAWQDMGTGTFAVGASVVGKKFLGKIGRR